MEGQIVKLQDQIVTTSKIRYREQKWKDHTVNKVKLEDQI